MLVRSFQASDLQDVLQLFYDTIQTVNCRDYTAEQIEVWSSGALQNPDRWLDRLQTSMTYVAEINGQLVGFTNLEQDGHIDLFYCHSHYQGQGVGSTLLRQIEATAHTQDIKRLFTEASITAKPFFQRRGFRVVREQQVERNAVQFRNFVMEKVL